MFVLGAIFRLKPQGRVTSRVSLTRINWGAVVMLKGTYRQTEGHLYSTNSAACTGCYSSLAAPVSLATSQHWPTHMFSFSPSHFKILSLCHDSGDLPCLSKSIGLLFPVLRLYHISSFTSCLCLVFPLWWWPAPPRCVSPVAYGVLVYLVSVLSVLCCLVFKSISIN